MDEQEVDSSGSATTSPDEIWARVSGVGHETRTALARRWAEDDEDVPDVEDGTEPEIDIRPSIKGIEPKTLTITLRAEARFADYLIQFEEAAAVLFDEDQQFSTEDVRAFGTRIILPFLLPYVESGFRRMCAEVEVPPPSFPFLAFRGNLYSLKGSDED